MSSSTPTMSSWSLLDAQGHYHGGTGFGCLVPVKDISDNCVPLTLRQQFEEEPHWSVMVWGGRDFHCEIGRA